MFNYRSKLTIMSLSYRVQQLEDILCPLNSHQWIQIDSKYVGDPLNGRIETTMQCSKCMKIHINRG